MTPRRNAQDAPRTPKTTQSPGAKQLNVFKRKLNEIKRCLNHVQTRFSGFRGFGVGFPLKTENQKLKTPTPEAAA